MKQKIFTVLKYTVKIPWGIFLLFFIIISIGYGPIETLNNVVPPLGFKRAQITQIHETEKYWTAQYSNYPANYRYDFTYKVHPQGSFTGTMLFYTRESGNGYGPFNHDVPSHTKDIKVYYLPSHPGTYAARRSLLTQDIVYNILSLGAIIMMVIFGWLYMSNQRKKS